MYGREPKLSGVHFGAIIPLLPVRAQAMFGDVGLYTGDVFVAIIADDTLYFGTDAQTRVDY